MMARAKFQSSEDSLIIAELLPYIAPHEGVLRTQLHRDNKLTHQDEMRFIFSFTCGKCGHKHSIGYAITVVLSNREPALSAMASRLAEFCDEIRRYPCIAAEEMAEISQRVTEILDMHKTVTYEEFQALWETYWPSFPFSVACTVARHLGFQVPGVDYFELPTAHPWNKKS